jgi:SepF-like predicted cell division protein (DUF552 family)
MGNCQTDVTSYKNVKAANFKNETAVDEKVCFSSDEIQLVQNTWNHFDDLKELGIELMVSLLTKHPHLKVKFIFTHGLNTEAELRGNSQLVYHGSAIITVLDSTIKGLDSDDNSKVCEKLKKLGRSHFGYAIQPCHLKVKQDF